MEFLSWNLTFQLGMMTSCRHSLSSTEDESESIVITTLTPNYWTKGLLMWFLLFKISMFVLVIRPTANYINYQGALIP